jgi:hypothetical protein
MTQLYDMSSIQDQVLARMQSKHLDQHMIGELALSAVRDFLGIHEDIEGKVQFGKLFLKSSNNQVKVQLFLRKKQALEAVNTKLKKIGYKKDIIDIFVKQGYAKKENNEEY